MGERKITTIPASISKFTAMPINSNKKRRVAGYARVSTEKEDQLTSYEAQVEYYTNYIKNRGDWNLQEYIQMRVYQRQTQKKRVGFNKMISDAKAGKIDLIVTKSVSRFARNTVDSLTTVRELKDMGIEIYFEKENIWTLDSKGELLITIMSSLAQEESRSISENVIWGQRKRFADGKVSFAYSRVLGFEKGVDGEIVVNQEQAEIVKLIYRFFLEGMTPHSIKEKLTEMGIKSPTGKDRWNSSTVQSILTNEKYKGDALLQKEFTVDFLSKKMKKNEGEVPQYYVEGNHEAIIEPEVFDFVQAELERRKRCKSSKYSGVSIFSNKIKCGDCSGWFGSKVWHSNDKYRRVIYQCNHKYKDAKCKTPHITEDEIKEMFVKAYNKLLYERKEIISNIEQMKNCVLDTSKLIEKRDILLEEIKILTEKTQECVSRNASIAQDQKEYLKRYNRLVEEYDKAKNEYDELVYMITQKNAQRENMNRFIQNLKEREDIITEFDNSLWCCMVDFILVSREGNKVIFKDGTGIEV